MRASDARRSSTAFAAVPALYIADGHHRAASAARARQQLRGAGGEPGEWDTFLAVAFPDVRCRSCPTTASSRISASYTPAAFWPSLRASGLP